MASCCFHPAAVSRSAAAVSFRFFDVANFAKALCSLSFAMRFCVASKFIRKGRSTVTLRNPNSPVLANAGDDAGLGLTVDRHFGRLAVLAIAVDASQVADLLLGDLVALVVEALLHLLEEARAVDELHLAASLRRLAVRHEPDIGEDAGVVEKLVGQRHDGVEPVVLDDPAADVGRPRSGVAGEGGASR